jgi:DNA-binding CsgD family transcriptional regulator
MARIGAFLSMFLVIFLLDETGMIMDMFSVIGEFQEGLDLPGLELGMNLSKYFFGMNAISLAMDMGCVGIVRGFEHTVPIFQRWNSVCSPIFAAGSVQGYLSISVPVERQVEFAVPFLQQLSAKLAACRETEGKDHAEEFQQYNLSPRECEVALAWFLRKSALYISNELGIKEGTVRNIVKNIYSKMNVSDRSQFIKKLTH